MKNVNTDGEEKGKKEEKDLYNGCNDERVYAFDDNEGGIRVSYEIRGIAKYSRALMNLIPIRRRIETCAEEKESMPADDAGLFSYVFVNWMTRYLWKAHKEGITVNDLPKISRYDSSNHNVHRLERLWREEVNRCGIDQASFSRVAWMFVRTRVYVSCFLLTCSLIFGFISPTMLSRKILEHIESSNESIWSGFKWVLLLILCDFVRIAFFAWTWVTNFRTALRLKSACTTLLYKRIVTLYGFEANSSGEIINLFANDAQRLFDVIIYGPMIIGGPIVCFCSIVYILWRFNSMALLGMIAFLIFYSCQYLVSRATAYFRLLTVRATDIRIKSLNEILECIKLIKMYSWERYFEQNVLDIRNIEEKWIRKVAFLQSFVVSLTPAVPVICAIVTFLSYASSVDNRLKASEVFPLVSLLNAQIRTSFMFVQVALININESRLALNRLKDIMLLKKGNLRDPNCNSIVKSHAVSIVDGTFVYDDPEHRRELKQRKILRKSKSDHRSLAHDREEEEISVSVVSRHIQILVDIQFIAAKGKLTGICGHVGSGKSSLLLAALGQLQKTNGSVLRTGSCAYVGQQAWIVNATMKENILFGETFDAERYYKTIMVCGLKHDIEILPAGDETEIGERGVNLSGGQRQRVALARALYANRDIYFLDDPLSALDAGVASMIFENLVLGALKDKSVLLVTHRIQFLVRCDYIYVMSNGRVIEHGTHVELMKLNTEYASMVNTSEILLEAERDTSERYRNLDSTRRKCGRRYDNEITKLSSNEEVEGCKQNNDQGKLIVEDKVITGKISSKVYGIYVRTAGGYLVAALVFSIFFLNVGSSAFSSVWLATWIKASEEFETAMGKNETIQSQELVDNRYVSKSEYYKNIYAAFIGAILFTSFLRGLIITYATTKASTTLHNSMFKKIIQAPLQFFETTPIGRIQNLFTRDIDEVDNSLPMSIESMIQNILTCSFAIFFISYTLPWFCIPLILLGTLFFFVSKLFRVAIRDLKRMECASRSPILSFVTSTIQGLSTIHAFEKEKDFVKRFEKLMDANGLCLYLCHAAMRWSAVRLDGLAVTLSSITALLAISLRDQISPALAGLALAYSAQMSGVFQYTVRLMSETEMRFVSVERINYYLKTLKQEDRVVGKIAKYIDRNNIPVSHDWPSRGKIEFKNVSMRYREELPLVLIDISFVIRPGEKIGIVGRTGSGKTSLFAVLFRLTNISDGAVAIDDIDISRTDLKLLRSKLSVVPQDPVLFAGTVRTNLDPFGDYTDSEIWDSLGKTRLKEKIKSMSACLDAPIEFGGSNLSVGERQLLCLTRASLRRSKVLLLDEATAAVDPETEAIVQATIKNEFSECTVIMIAHRLQTVVPCDRILVMRDGRLAEFDTTTALLSNPHSEFSKMIIAEISV